MNKLIVFFSILVIFTTLSSFSVNPNDTYLICESNQQQRTVKAFLDCGGAFYEGSITYVNTNQGYVPLRYSFSQSCLGSACCGSFMENDSFVPLNPNNRYAVQYNWTHSISVFCGYGPATAYLILY
jgi:hypothetical protein